MVNMINKALFVTVACRLFNWSLALHIGDLSRKQLFCWHSFITEAATTWIQKWHLSQCNRREACSQSTAILGTRGLHGGPRGWAPSAGVA